MSDIISQKEIDKLLGVFDDCADKDPGEKLITPEILNQNANQNIHSNRSLGMHMSALVIFSFEVMQNFILV